MYFLFTCMLGLLRRERARDIHHNREFSGVVCCVEAMKVQSKNLRYMHLDKTYCLLSGKIRLHFTIHSYILCLIHSSFFSVSL